ncbi:MAG: alpha/beta fold hydrolase [Candidatus Nanopelagicales bacterium]|nr:alpha/beta fold hydrolase [Candidatus Nanopelagicales bacterium]
MNSPAHLLLVHGASHGAWCWSGVIQELDRLGVPATAFNLPGSGSDTTPRRDVTLQDYLAATIQQVDDTDATRVVLVGHSLAGIILPSVAAARPEKVEALVFVASVVLNSGERGIDSIPEDRRDTYFDMARESEDYTILPNFENGQTRFFSHLGLAAAQEAYAQLTPQPFEPYLSEVARGVDSVVVPSAYVLLEQDVTFKPPVAEGFASKAGVVPDRMAGDHCVMLSDPFALAEKLAHYARRDWAT